MARSRTKVGIQIRKFGPEVKTPGHRPGATGVSGVVVQLPREADTQLSAEEMARRFKGQPIVMNREDRVTVLYFDPHGEIDEHDAREPILFVVIGGSGFVRLGGPDGETVEVHPGDALLWPKQVLHKVWTDDDPLQAIVIHYAKDGTSRIMRRLELGN